MPARFAAAKQAGASDDEIMEALYFAMRAAARATWSTIKNIPGVEEMNKQYQATHEKETKK